MLLFVLKENLFVYSNNIFKYTGKWNLGRSHVLVIFILLCLLNLWFHVCVDIGVKLHVRTLELPANSNQIQFPLDWSYFPYSLLPHNLNLVNSSSPLTRANFILSWFKFTPITRTLFWKRRSINLKVSGRSSLTSRNLESLLMTTWQCTETKFKPRKDHLSRVTRFKVHITNWLSRVNITHTIIIRWNES